MKVALVCIAKGEELYLDDWIIYHKNKGFNTIIVCDNNDINSNTQKDIAERYGYVKYEDYRGKQSYQNKCYMEVYKKYHKLFDWIAFWDVDEFIQFDKYTSINEFLSPYKAQLKVNAIFLNWKCFGDSGRALYENIPVYERFTESYPKDIVDPTWPSHKIHTHIKSIMKCCSESITFKVPHNATHNTTLTYAVNAEGRVCTASSPWQDICWKGAWLNHYCTLTIDEFFSRRMKRGRATTKKKRTPLELCNLFFIYNKNTIKKMEVLRKYIPNLIEK